MKRSITEQQRSHLWGGPSADSASVDIERFDMKKLDKIPKSQLQSLHMVHEHFARNLASSLSAYLRSYVALNLVSMEQLSYGEFLEGVSSPACIAYISLAPYDGTAVLDLNANVVFRLIELLLGSKEQSSLSIQRKITDIEKRLMQTLLRVILHGLQESWKSVAEIDFAVQSLVSDPQMLHVLPPSEAMIVIAIEVRVGTISGLMNLAIPSILIKRLKNNFDQVQKVRKSEPTETDQLQIARLLQAAKLRLDIRIPGGNVSAKTLLDLKSGDVLILDQPGNGFASGLLNGKQKWVGKVLTEGRKLAFEIV
jgi:flagellar motor switch protein FliM